MADYRSAEARAYRHLYNQARWKHPKHGRRAQQLQAEPLCKMCLAQGRTKAASVADHVVEHKGDEALFWEGELQSLCAPHHDSTKQGDEKRGFSGKVDANGWPTDPRHMANGGTGSLSRDYEERRLPTDLKPSAIPLTILCGPPGSGKSTYLRQHAGPNDTIIDLDAIMQRISGLPEHHTSPRWLGKALDERNRQLRALATDTAHAKAWFIVAAPDPTERRTWARRLGGQVVTLDTPLAECIRRIEADPARRGQTERMIEAAKAWWKANATT